MRCTRIDQAASALIRKRVIQASLIARDAGIDFISAILCDFVDEIRIGQKRSRHRYHVRVAAGDNVLGNIGRVNAIRGDHGNRHRSF